MLPLQARVDLGMMAMKWVLCLPQSSSITRASPSHYCHIQDSHRGGGGLTPLQRCSLCILQLQLTGEIYLFKMIKNYINILTLKTLVLQLSIKCLPF